MIYKWVVPKINKDYCKLKIINYNINVFFIKNYGEKMTEEDLQKRTNELRKEENRFVNVLNRATAGSRQEYNPNSVKDLKKMVVKNVYLDYKHELNSIELKKQELMAQTNNDNISQINELNDYENKLNNIKYLSNFFKEMKYREYFNSTIGDISKLNKYFNNILSTVPQINSIEQINNCLDKLKKVINTITNEKVRNGLINIIETKRKNIKDNNSIDYNKNILSDIIEKFNTNLEHIKTSTYNSYRSVFRNIDNLELKFNNILKERPQCLNDQKQETEKQETKKQETQKQNMPKEKIKTENKIENSSKINSIQTNTQSLSNSNATKNKIQVEKKEAKELKTKKFEFNKFKNFFKNFSLSKAIESMSKKTKSKESGIGK